MRSASSKPVFRVNGKTVVLIFPVKRPNWRPPVFKKPGDAAHTR